MWLVLSATSQANELTPFDAQYRVTSQGITVTAERSLSRTSEGRYTFRQELGFWLLKFREQSHFSIDANGKLRTHSYEQEQKTLGKKRSVEQAFDWQNQTVTSEYKRETNQYAIDEHTLDPLNFQLQLQLDLLKEDPDTRALSYHVTGKRSLKTDYRLHYATPAVLSTALGELATQQVTMYRDDGSRIDIWLATALENLPVKAVLSEPGGEKSEIHIKQYTPRTPEMLAAL